MKNEFSYAETVQEQRRQITRHIIAHRNGEMVEALKNGGLDYKVNLGVPYSDLKKIAQNFEAGAAISQVLWDKEWRETRIISSILADADALSLDNLVQRMLDAQSTELLEFLAFYVSSKRASAKEELSQFIIHENKNVFISALYTVIRLSIATQDKKVADYFVELLIKSKKRCAENAETINLLAKALSRAAYKSSYSFDEIKNMLLLDVSDESTYIFVLETVKAEMQYR